MCRPIEPGLYTASCCLITRAGREKAASHTHPPKTIAASWPSDLLHQLDNLWLNKDIQTSRGKTHRSFFKGIAILATSTTCERSSGITQQLKTCSFLRSKNGLQTLSEKTTGNRRRGIQQGYGTCRQTTTTAEKEQEGWWWRKKQVQKRCVLSSDGVVFLSCLWWCVVVVVVCVGCVVWLIGWLVDRFGAPKGGLGDQRSPTTTTQQQQQPPKHTTTTQQPPSRLCSCCIFSLIFRTGGRDPRATKADEKNAARKRNAEARSGGQGQSRRGYDPSSHPRIRTTSNLLR